MGIDCSQDPGVFATFLCARCKRPFCENCVGLEDGHKVYCLACAAVEGISKKGEGEEKGKVAKPLKGAFFISLFLLVVIGGYSGAAKYLHKIQKEPPPPLTEAQEMDLAKCMENLEALSMLVAEYQVINHRDPEDIEDVITLEKDKPLLIEPVEKYEYGLDNYPAIGLVIACPNPDAHHLFDLYARPGIPAVAVKEGD